MFRQSPLSIILLNDIMNSMKNFYRGGKRFGGGRDLKRRDFDRRDSRNSDRSSMHRTTCSECGKDCEVPFVPTGNRPVYCNSCFEHKRSSSEPHRFENRNTGDRGKENTGDQYKKQFESLNWKLDKIIKILSPVVSPKIADEIKTVLKKEGPKPKIFVDVKKKKAD